MDSIKEVIKNTSIQEWIVVSLEIGAIAAVIIYFKTVMRALKVGFKEIYKAISEGNGLNTRELMGGTCWVLFVITSLKYLFFGFELNIEWVGILLLYFCVMYGIEAYKTKKVTP